jgi:hypothetical protein
VYPCCGGATESGTDDSPQIVFDRLVAVLEKDHFYDIEPSQLTQSDGAAFYSITVMRCGAQPHDKSIAIAFLGAPEAEPNTSILAINIPFGSFPEVLYDSRVLTLFGDFTRAIYQSKWNPPDIY